MGILSTLLYRTRSMWPPLKFNGLLVPVAGDHISLQIWKTLWKQCYEGPEILAVNQLVKPGDKILEMGSGIGVVSAIASKISPDIQIEAYEANPSLIKFIQHLHKLNDIENVHVNNAILLPTNKETSRKLNLRTHFTESSILDAIESEQSVEIPVKDFRKVLKDFRPDVLICDIEGGEEELFNGIDLSGFRAIILEIHPHLISRKTIKRIYNLCAHSNLYPCIEYSGAQVVAFERIEVSEILVEQAV